MGSVDDVRQEPGVGDECLGDNVRVGERSSGRSRAGHLDSSTPARTAAITITARILPASPRGAAGSTAAVVMGVVSMAVVGTVVVGSWACPGASPRNPDHLRPHPLLQWQPEHRRYRHGCPNRSDEQE